MVWPFKRKGDNEVEETRRPSNSRFKQQKLPAWQPILTAYTVLPIFFFIGAIFIPIGIGLLVSSNRIKEKVIEYSEYAKCIECERIAEPHFKNASPSNCSCDINFTLDTKWQGDVYFYYGLSNFYQNHRRYVRSRDDGQLHGSLSNSVNSNCEPFDKANDSVAYAPCGAIANSMFTDVFQLIYTVDDQEVPLTYKNIAWKSDRDTKFKNPKNMNEFKEYHKPKNWVRNVTDLDPNDPSNNGFVNQDFIVWMRVAAFPTFRKLYRKLDHDVSAKFEDGLPNGEYQLRITYNYPVKSFNGKKRFIITTSSWMGGKNSFLGITYIVVGCLCILLGFVCFWIHMKVRTKPLMD